QIDAIGQHPKLCDMGRRGGCRVTDRAWPGSRPMTLLDLVIAIPAIGFLIALVIPRVMENFIRIFALGFSLLTFVVSLGLVAGFQSGHAGQQFVTNIIWIQSPEIHY